MTADLELCGTVEVFCGGVWVDISDRVDIGKSPCEAQHGRQTVLVTSDADASSLTLVLRDDDREFMPGNTASSLYPDFDAGTPIRWTDVVSATTVWHFNGVIENVTGLTVTDEADGGDAIEQWAVVSAVDLVTQLDRKRAFVSTLGAHIIRPSVSPTGVLDHFWPLNDAAEPYAPRVGTYPLLVSITPAATGSPDTPAAVLPAGGDVIYGDDTLGAYLQMGVNGAASADSPTLNIGVGGIGGGFVPPSGAAGFGGDAILLWIKPELPFDEAVTILTGTTSWQSTGNATWTLKRLASGSGGVFELAVTGSVTGTVTSTVTMGTDRWYLLGASVHVAAASTPMKLWVDDEVFTGSGSGAGTIPIFDGGSLTIGGKLQGSILYAQSYSIAPSDAEVLEQRQVGLYGLHRQTVSERINSILTYAGVDLADTSVEDSLTTMQTAQLAGRRPGAAIRAAVTTDQGVWFGAPDGTATFQSRRHRYYDPDAAPIEVPYTLIGSPFQTKRDLPINSATVQQAGNGAVGYAQDTTSIESAVGEQPFETSLECASKSAPAVLASFVVHQFVTPKTRPLELLFDVDNFAAADQLKLLSLAIGDRIQITNPPAGWPSSLAHLSIEGRKMTAGSQNLLTLTGSPVLGSPGGSDTWFRLGTSALGGTDVLPF